MHLLCRLLRRLLLRLLMHLLSSRSLSRSLATTISAASLTAGGFTYLCEKRGCASAAALPVCMCIMCMHVPRTSTFAAGWCGRVAGTSPAARSSVRAICVRALVPGRDSVCVNVCVHIGPPLPEARMQRVDVC